MKNFSVFLLSFIPRNRTVEHLGPETDNGKIRLGKQEIRLRVCTRSDGGKETGVEVLLDRLLSFSGSLVLSNSFLSLLFLILVC